LELGKYTWVTKVVFLFFLLPLLGFSQDTLIYKLWESEVKDNNQRIQLYTKVIDAKPDEWAFYYRGWAYLGQNKLSLAQQDFQLILGAANSRILPAAPMAGMAQRYFQDGDYKMAIRWADKSLESSLNNAIAYRIRGKSKARIGDLLGAATDLDFALALEPMNAENYGERASVAWLSDDSKLAVINIEKAIALNPKDEKYQVRKVWIKIMSGTTENLESLINSLYNIKTDDPELNYQLGQIFFANEKYIISENYFNAALGFYENQIRNDNGYAQRKVEEIYPVYLERGLCRQYQEKFRDALNDFSRASQLKPEDPLTYLHMGELHTFQENYVDAIQAYEKAFRINPRLSDGWLNLGYSYFQIGKPQEAIVAYERGIMADSTDCMLYNNKGYTLLELKEFSKGIQEINKSIQLCPDAMMPRVSKGEYYFMAEAYDEAISQITLAFQMPDSNSAALAAGYYTRGKSYLQKKELKKAIDDFNNSLKIEPQRISAIEQLGIAYYRLEEFCKAYHYFKFALGLDVRNEIKQAPVSAYYVGMIQGIVIGGCP